MGIKLVAFQQLAGEFHVGNVSFDSMLWETLLVLCIEKPIAPNLRGIEHEDCQFQRFQERTCLVEFITERVSPMTSRRP